MDFAREFEMTSGSLPKVLKDQFDETGDMIREIGLWFSEPSADRMPRFLDALLEMTTAERIFLVHQDGQGNWECPLARDLDRENIRQPLSKVLLPLVERTLESAELWSCEDIPGLPDRARWDRGTRPRTHTTFSASVERQPAIFARE